MTGSIHGARDRDAHKTISPAARIERAIRAPKVDGGPALVAYITAGFPTLDAFAGLVAEVSDVADVVEIGIPFSDPMADGATIQEASRVAISNGASLSWTLDALKNLKTPPAAPLVVMSYLNPVMRFGMERFASVAAAAHVDGVILPDLPYDEADRVAGTLRDRSMAVVQMATIVSSEERLGLVGAATAGFLYAVTSVGTTGRGALDTSAATAFLDRIRGMTTSPVCAGFGVRSAQHVQTLAPHCDGVIVGSALIEHIAAGESAGGFLASLRGK